MLVTDGTTLHLLGFPPTATLCGYAITRDDVRAGTWQEVGLIPAANSSYLTPCSSCTAYVRRITDPNF